jgi:hypothetical protein
MAKPTRAHNSDPLIADQERQTLLHSVQALQVPTVEQIRLRAYELYLQRGSVHGYAEQDWLQAESELKDAALSGSVMEKDGHLQVNAA